MITVSQPTKIFFWYTLGVANGFVVGVGYTLGITSLFATGLLMVAWCTFQFHQKLKGK